MSTKQEVEDSNDREMSNMFASVWVKVEVVEEPQPDAPAEEEKEIAGPINYTIPKVPIARKATYKKKNRKRPVKKDKYKCDECDYTSGYKNCLAMHMNGHTNEKKFSCGTCGYSTKYPTSLHRHMVVRHNTDVNESQNPSNVYKCESCDYTSPYKWNLSAHKRKHKIEKQYKCIHCPFETAYRHSFVKHAKMHRDPIVFKCDKCPFVTRFEGHISRHLSQIHNEIESSAKKCDHCNFATKYNWRLNIHKARSKKETVIKCGGACDFQTFYKCEYKKHKASHFSAVGVLKHSPVEVEINTDGTTNDDVDDHEETPDDSNRYDHVTLDDLAKYSEMNLASFNEITNFNESSGKSKKKGTLSNYDVDPDCVDWHDIQVLESDDKEKPFQCHMCNYTSRFKAAVQRHFQRHHTGRHNRPYKCCNCDFSTKTKDQISLHNKRSKTDTAAECTTCGFKTFFKCQFVMHQKNHYAFKCDQCSYSCRHNYELQKHVWSIHLGHGLKCRFCEYRTTRKESMLCHETIHTGNKPFKCNLCDYSSVRKSLLDNHTKRNHGELLNNEVTFVNESKIDSLIVPLSLIKDRCD